MGDRTGIEWTEATWNPVTGCTEVSSGCKHCYAARLARGRLATRYLQREPVNRHVRQDDPFAVRLWPERLDEPRAWQKPRRVFVCSMSDLFHRQVPKAYLRDVFVVMLHAKQHVYQVLTKRPALAADFLHSFWGSGLVRPSGLLPPHIWVGTSIETQDFAYRATHLNNIPAEVRFLSCEPLLGPLRIRPSDMRGVDWVIVGGESGPGARPMDPVWVLLLLEQCRMLGIPFFMKQMGSAWANINGASDSKGGNPIDWPEALRVREYPL